MGIIISNFYLIFLLTYLGNHFLLKKINNNLLFFLAVILMSIINYNGTSSTKTIFLCLVQLLYFLLVFNGKFTKKIMILLTFYLTILFSEIIVGIFMNLLGFINEQSQPSDTMYTISLLISMLINTILIIFYCKTSHLLIIKSIPKYSYTLFLLPFISILLFIRVNNYYELVENHSSFLLVVIFFAFSNLLLIVLFFSIINTIYIKKELEIEKYEQHSLKSEIDSLNQLYERNYVFLHDLLHACNTLNQLVNEEKYDDVKKEIDTLADTIYKKFNVIHSNYTILDKIIDSKIKDIKELGIFIKNDIQFNEFDFISLYDQDKLFYLLLDIPIEAYKMHQDAFEKIIIIKTKKSEQQILIQLIFNNVLQNISNIKINNIKNVINKYNGKFSIIEQKNHQINIIIYFQAL